MVSKVTISLFFTLGLKEDVAFLNNILLLIREIYRLYVEYDIIIDTIIACIPMLYMKT